MRASKWTPNLPALPFYSCCLRSNPKCEINLALSLLRIYLAGAMLASAGETNTYSKWRVRLLDRHKEVLGGERVEIMTRYLFPDPKSDASATVREALSFADETFDDILARCPEIVPAISAMNSLFPFVKQVDEVFQQERSAAESGT